MLTNANNFFCPLCKTHHIPKFLCFTPRKIPDKDNNSIDSYVLRFICIQNKIFNKNLTKSKIAQKKQYTVTILPSFLQPYSRRVTERITDAVDKYVNGKSKNYLEAALSMNAESEQTFRRYYNRTLNRIIKWCSLIGSLITLLDGIYKSNHMSPNVYLTNQSKWSTFILLVSQYCTLKEKISSPHLILYGEYKMRHVLALLAQNNLGLGP